MSPIIKRCEATFPCKNCGISITIRTNSLKVVTCKKCNAWYEMLAFGVNFKRIKYYIKASDDKPIEQGYVTDATITVDETEVGED